jgi:Concanavalin A-like lectin/glucanases superfamily
LLLLCFAGCSFSPGALSGGFTEYSNNILAEPTLVAYWPLGEPDGEVTANDLKGTGGVHRSGTYLSQVFPADPAMNSAAAPGTLQLGQPGLLEGDRVSPFGLNDPRTTCIAVNGGYVSVPYDPALNPSKADGFTIEAWVHTGWSADPTVSPPGHRTIMTALDQIGGLRGYWLFASKDNMWEVFLGNGPGPTIVTGPAVQLDTTTHVVLSYDGNLLRLFIDGSQVAAMATDYVPTDQSRLFIGAGAPHIPQPRFPWVGNIQCVALYKGALDANQVAKHTVWGNGGFTS